MGLGGGGGEEEISVGGFCLWEAWEGIVVARGQAAADYLLRMATQQLCILTYFSHNVTNTPSSEVESMFFPVGLGKS